MFAGSSLLLHDDLDAAILLPAFRIIRAIRLLIGGRRLAFAEAGGLKICSAQPLGAQKPIPHRLGPALGKLSIVIVGAFRIRMAFDADASTLMFPDDLRDIA